jgi:hypothetical protein
MLFRRRMYLFCVLSREIFFGILLILWSSQPIGSQIVLKGNYTKKEFTGRRFNPINRIRHTQEFSLTLRILAQVGCIGSSFT